MKKIYFKLITFYSLIFNQISFAGDVEEAAMVEYLKTIAELNILMEGYENTMQAYQLAIRDDVTAQLNALTGISNYGTLLNTVEDFEKLKWSPEEWASAVSGGNNQRYQDLLIAYQEAHPTLTVEESNDGMSSASATDYQQQVKTNQAASTNATYAFNNTNAHLQNIKTISDEINETQDTKRIQDLNARLNTEIAYLQVEVIKGIAVINEQLAQQQASDITDRTAAAKFNKIPN